jgi:endonuclease/exonuclease/phosphatase family metal-dependent hydrolase
MDRQPPFAVSNPHLENEVVSKYVLRATIALLCLSVMVVAGCSSGQGACGRNACPASSVKPTSQAGSVEVMTYNIRTATVTDLWNHWVFRRRSVCDTMAANDPDIMGVQEAKGSQVADIEKALPQYTSYAVGRVNGKRGGETNAIFYRTDRFTLMDKGTFWFSDKPDKPGSGGWGNIYPRICTWVRLADRETGRSFYVYNMHLDVFSQNSREKSIALLANRISNRKTRDPYIVMGDFNMKADNPACAYLDLMECKSARPGPVLAEALSEGSDIGTRHEFMGTRPRIDQIRVSKGLVGTDLTVDRRKADGRDPSDHYAVTARVFLGTPVARAAGAQNPQPM